MSLDEETTQKQDPVFVEIKDLRPTKTGLNITVKVVSSKTVVDRTKPDGSKVLVSECMVGDGSGIVVFTAKNEQVSLMKPGATVTLRNAKVEMYRGCMRLVVDKWGLVEAAADAGIVPKEDNNLSEVEYELIPFPSPAAQQA